MAEEGTKRRSGKSRTGSTKPSKIAADLRHFEALRLRLAKFTLQEIADTLGYETPQGAKAAIGAAMQKVGVMPTKQAVAAELADLQAMEEAIIKSAQGFPRVIDENGEVLDEGAPPNLDVIKSILEIKKLRAKLQGLEAPVKVASTDPSGEHPAPIVVLPAAEGILPPTIAEQVAKLAASPGEPPSETTN